MTLKKSLVPFTIIFGLIVASELITGSVPQLSLAHYFIKPVIVMALLLYYWIYSITLSPKIRYYVIFALICSVIGDILLMFVEVSPNYFLCGLVAFLLAHILYVLAFLTHRNPNRNAIGFIFGLLVYATGLFYLLKDGLNDMLVPVVIYMIVILSMATTAFLRHGMVPNSSFVLTFCGAVLFMISDSILALNKFYQPLAYSQISIMLSYAMAQYFIVVGLLRLDERNS